MSRTDLDLERYRRLAARSAPPRRPPDGGAPAFVGTVASATANIAAGKYLLMNPAVVLGAETEGGAGSIVGDTSHTVPVLLLGGTPATGDNLIARSVDYRWVTGQGQTTSSGTGNTVTGCPCTDIPATLNMSVTNPFGCNNLLQNCTFQWGPRPAGLAALGIQDPGYYSTQQFTDPASGDLYWFYLYCEASSPHYYAVACVYATSVYGSPYITPARYHWLAASGSNTCSPFALIDGGPYQGGTCTATITG